MYVVIPWLVVSVKTQLGDMANGKDLNPERCLVNNWCILKSFGTKEVAVQATVLIHTHLNSCVLVHV